MLLIQIVTVVLIDTGLDHVFQLVFANLRLHSSSSCVSCLVMRKYLKVNILNVMLQQCGGRLYFNDLIGIRTNARL